MNCWLGFHGNHFIILVLFIKVEWKTFALCVERSNTSPQLIIYRSGNIKFLWLRKYNTYCQLTVHIAFHLSLCHGSLLTQHSLIRTKSPITKPIVLLFLFFTFSTEIHVTLLPYLRRTLLHPKSWSRCWPPRKEVGTLWETIRPLLLPPLLHNRSGPNTTRPEVLALPVSLNRTWKLPWVLH